MSADIPERSDPGLRFETVPYQPDGGCPPLGLLLMLVVGVSLAAVTGVLTVKAFPYLLAAVNWIPEWHLYLLAVAAAFMVINAPLMLLVRAAVRWGRLRNLVVVTFVALLVSVVLGATVVLLGFDLVGMLLQALVWEDVVFSLIVYGVIFVVTAVILVGVSRKAASEPYCVECGSWKKIHFTRKVGMPAHVLLQAVQTGDVVPLADHDLSREGALTLTVTACPRCGLEAPSEVKLDHTSYDGRGRASVVTLTHVRYPGHAAIVLEEIFRPQPPST